MSNLLDKQMGKTGEGKGVAVALKKKIFEDTGTSNLGSKQSLLKVNYVIPDKSKFYYVCQLG